MKCPYCGNDDPGKLIYPDQYTRAFMTCLNCDGDFGTEEVEYYQGQGDDESEEEDKLLSLAAIIQALEYEIEWSKGNVHLAPNQNDVDWFIKGLEQAKWLILEVSKLDSQDDLSTLEPKEDSPTGTPGWMGDYGGIPHGPFDA